ncbi:MAG TPA: HEAT repeat domain-containing protein, partial [Polyangiaceae bacterium]|nr:HEAT repeat domain-containing protein [Polyangiaceae bacterium]
SPRVRAEAALSLTRLGALETVELARHWLKKSDDPELVRAGTEILALARADEWPDAITRLLLQRETRAVGLTLALAAPHPRLVAALGGLLTDRNSDTTLVLSALGRASSAEAARLLGRELLRPEHASAAAYALALMEDSTALVELEQALAKTSPRALAARALVVREFRLRASSGDLEDTLEELLKARSADDRAAGAWGLATLDPARARALLKARDPIVVRAAARAGLRGDAAKAAAMRLIDERDPLTRAALAVCLVDGSAADLVPTRNLEMLLAEVPGAAPLVVRALAQRDSLEQRPRIEQLLASPETALRAHVALGLGESRSPSAVGLLERSYAFEASAEVRRAIIVALSKRTESTRLRTLRLAATLDGDAATRESARLALSGQRLTFSGGGTFWLRVASSEGAGSAGRVVEVGTPSGLVLPAVSDPSGIVAFTDLPEGPLTLRLADAPHSNNAWSP